MKKIVLGLLVCLAIASCKKDKHELKPFDYTLTYEVITSSGKWFGEYIDSTGAHVLTNGLLSSGWKYTFKLKSFPFEMFVSATSDSRFSGSAGSPDVTINFYSNGVLFKTETNNWAKGVTSLDYPM
jgi:hypothetical protein